MFNLILYFYLLFLVTPVGWAQVVEITIEECHALAEENYPLVKQRDLISKSLEYSLEKASKGYLPRMSIAGQATYQSAVTEIPIDPPPGQEIPTPTRDQYKVYGELTQTIFDGGTIRQQKNYEESSALVEEQRLEVELYKLKERVNQLFFGILIVDAQLSQNEILQKDIQLGLNKVQASVNNGTALKSSADILKADLLKAIQRTIELKASRKGYLNMLTLFINKKLDENTVLVRPVPLQPTLDIQRPEMKLFDNQGANLEAQSKILKTRVLPNVNFFVQAGYGKPALNILSNTFDPYYIGGIRFQWSLSNFYTLKNDLEIISVNKRNVELQKQTFVFNTNYVLNQQESEVDKLKELLEADDEIILLRTNIKNNSSALLENGVISTSDYLREVNAEDQARQFRLLHELQLLMAQYTRQTTAGI